MWLCMAMFLLLYYNISLNLIRQSLCLAMCLYSFKYIENRNLTKLIIWTIIIISTHNTGIFFLFFIAFYFTYNMRKSIIRNIFLYSMYLFALLCIISYEYLIVFAVTFNILPEKFLEYIQTSGNTGIPKSSLILYLYILICIIIINYKTKNISHNISKENKFTRTNKVIGIIIFLTSIISKWAFRISYYFNYICDCILFPRVLYSVKNKNKSLYNLILFTTICFCIIMWLWIIAYNNENETYPYKSKILGIQ